MTKGYIGQILSDPMTKGYIGQILWLRWAQQSEAALRWEMVEANENVDNYGRPFSIWQSIQAFIRDQNFSLIWEFFPTPSTTLENSANLLRIFFLEGGGYRGIGVQWPKMALEYTIGNPRNQKISGEAPQAPLKEAVSFWVHLTNTRMHYQDRHHALSDFLVETHFDPWIALHVHHNFLDHL